MLKLNLVCKINKLIILTSDRNCDCNWYWNWVRDWVMGMGTEAGEDVRCCSSFNAGTSSLS